MNIDKGLLLGGISFVALAVAGSGAAMAQTGAVGQPTQRQDRPDVRTPAAVAAESYDPRGVPVGSFRLFPELELDEVYNDNIYAVSNGTGKTGSFIQLIKPKLDLRSDWSRHMLNLFARGSFGIYGTDSLNDYQDYSIGADGRVDIQRDWNVYGGGSFSRAHEERGSPNTVSTSTLAPNVYNQLAGNVGYFQRFNRLTGRLDARLDNYTYQDQGLGPSGGSIFNSDRNRTEFREAARFGYEFSPGFEVWTRGGLNQRRYVNGVDSSGFARDSNGYDIVGGLAVDFGGITSVEAFAGYMQQTYVDSRFPTLSGLTFGLAGYWNPLRELWVKPFVRRTIEDSALNNTSAYINTAAGVDVEYRFRPNIRANGHFDYAIADYNAVSGSANRYDQYTTFRGDVMYLPTEKFFVGPSYQFVHRASSVANSDYDQSVIMLRLGAHL